MIRRFLLKEWTLSLIWSAFLLGYGWATWGLVDALRTDESHDFQQPPFSEDQGDGLDLQALSEAMLADEIKMSRG